MIETRERMMQIAAALRSGTQADAEGVMVTVSRQACEEAAAELDRVASAGSGRDRMREELEFLRGMSDDVVESYEKFEKYLQGRIEHFDALHQRDLAAGKIRGNSELRNECIYALEAFREIFTKKQPATTDQPK